MEVFVWKKRFLKNETVSTKPSMQEQKHKSLKWHSFTSFQKYLKIKSPDILTKQNYPIAKFFQPQSKPTQTHVHFNGIN